MKPLLTTTALIMVLAACSDSDVLNSVSYYCTSTNESAVYAGSGRGGEDPYNIPFVVDTRKGFRIPDETIPDRWPWEGTCSIDDITNDYDNSVTTIVDCKHETNNAAQRLIINTETNTFSSVLQFMTMPRSLVQTSVGTCTET